MRSRRRRRSHQAESVAEILAVPGLLLFACRSTSPFISTTYCTRMPQPSEHQHKQRRRSPKPPSSRDITAAAASSKSSRDRVKKPKKTKSEKICELEGALKFQKEETKRLRAQIELGGKGISISSDHSKSDSKNGNDASDEKLKEAVRALKRVTVQQEMSLRTLRQKAKQRRAELLQKDAQIKHYQNQLTAYQTAQEKMETLKSENPDMAKLMMRIADLELTVAKQDSTHKEQLEESTKVTKSLKDQLEGLTASPRDPKPPGRNVSSRSLSSSQSSKASTVEDLNKMKRELAKKMETIAKLEFDLEAAQEEITELKQRQASAPPVGFDNPFPVAVFPESEDDDFFSENDDDDDDFWG